MYLVREVFHAKPGKAKDLVKKFKQVGPFMEKQDVKNYRVMTDVTGGYWTVVSQFEIEDIGNFFKDIRPNASQPDMAEMSKIMEGYMELVNGGMREIYLIE